MLQNVSTLLLEKAKAKAFFFLGKSSSGEIVTAAVLKVLIITKKIKLGVADPQVG